jgi:hypothetical protein
VEPPEPPKEGTEMMHRLLMAGFLLLLTGCGTTSVRGPFARSPDRVDDPFYTISEQERRGRERLSLPDNSPAVAPPTLMDRPGPNGR